MSVSDFTQQYLKEILDYNIQTGIFRWKVQPVGSCAAGSLSGNLRPDGYRQISVKYRLYKAHRLAWLYVYGKWPLKQIDHINGNRDDNRIENLRDVSPRVNTQNQKTARSDNVCGLMGVRWHSPSKKWQARIGSDRKQKSLGLYDTAAIAHAVYIAAKREIHPGCVI